MGEMLTVDELAILDEHLRPLTFNLLFAKWGELLRSLDGYQFTIFDYDNDIDSRVLIQKAVDMAPVELQVKIWAILHELDAAFLAQTVTYARPNYLAGSWHTRFPKFPGPELVNDLAARGWERT